MDDDCVIIVDSGEKQECEQKEVFVISSDSDDSNDDSASKPEKSDTNLENPMHNEDDLKKTEPTEEQEGDVLLQRLKKKLLAYSHVPKHDTVPWKEHSIKGWLKKSIQNIWAMSLRIG